MTRYWRWFNDQETGPLGAGTAEGFVNPEQDTWRAQGHSVANPETTIVYCGKCSHKVATAGFGTDVNASLAHVEAFAQRYLYWGGYLNITGFAGLPVAYDLYCVFRCAEVLNGGPADYLGVGGYISSVVNSTYKFIPSVMRFNSNGSYDTFLLEHETEYTNNTGGWVWWVLRYDTDTDKVKLYVDDVASVQEVAAGVVQQTPHMLKDNRILSAKGADAGPQLYFDVMGSCDDTSSGPPSVDTKVALFQPDADDVARSEWAGSPDNTDKYRNWDDKNDAAPVSGDDNTPSASGQEQGCDFKDHVSGDVDGVRIVWLQRGNSNGVLGGEHVLYADGQDQSAKTGCAYHNNSFPGALEGRWYGVNLSKTPAGLDWTFARLNGLNIYFDSADGTNPIEEVYVMVIGDNIAWPAETEAPPAVTHIRAGVSIGTANPMVFAAP